MVWTGRVDYDGRVVIVISVNTSRLLRRVYVIVPTSVAIIIIVVDILIILSRNAVLVSLVTV